MTVRRLKLEMYQEELTKYKNEKIKIDSYSYKGGLKGEKQRIPIMLRNLENTATMEIVKFSL